MTADDLEAAGLRAPKVRRRIWGTHDGTRPEVMLGLAWLAYFYFGGMTASYAPILSSVESDLHLSHTQGGVLLGIYPLVYIAGALALGRISDVVGVKRSIAAALLIIALSAFLRAPAQTYWELILATAPLGVGGSVVSTVLPKLVAEWFQGPSRTMASGVYVTGPTVGGTVALALSNSVGMPLLGSWRGIFVVYGCVGLVVLAIWLAAAQDSEQAVAGDDQLASPTVCPSVARSRSVLRVPAVWMVVLVGVAVFTIGQGLSSWLPTILMARGESASAAGTLVSISRFLQVPATIGITFGIVRIARTNVRKGTLLLLIGVTFVSVALLTFDDHTTTVVALILQGLAAGGLLSLLMSILMDLPEVPASQMATAAGLFFTVGQVAGAGSPVLVGWLRDATGGFTVGLGVVATVVLLAAIPALALHDAHPGVSRLKAQPQA